jgi:hypothetical protein
MSNIEFIRAQKVILIQDKQIPDDIFILRSDTQRGPSQLNRKVLVCIGRESERLGQLKKIKVFVYLGQSY